MSYIPPPKYLEAFPDAQIVKPKTFIKGTKKLRKRWKDPAGNIYEWDSLHGRVEKYNQRGIHLGEFDAKTGQQTGSEDSTRRVEP